MNTSWLAAEKLIRMGAALVVGILVARYLGPEQYGVLAYCLSMLMLFTVITHMGLDGMTVRELIHRPEEKSKILGTVFGIKWLASIVAFIAMVVFAWFSSDNQEHLMVLLCLSVVLLLQPKITVEFWFESKIQGKYTAIAKTLSLAAAAVFKVIFILLGGSLYWFGFASLLEAVVLLVVLVFLYRRTSELNFSSWHYSSCEAKSLLSRGWMVMLGSIFAMIYKRIDQAMLMWMQGAEEVGIYAVATQLSEAWNFLPLVIVASAYPVLIKLKKTNNEAYLARLQQTFDLLMLLAIGLAVATTLIATPLIKVLFGEAFLSSASVLVIHIWSSVFVFLRTLLGKWIHIEQVLMFALLSQLVGASANVILNLYFIPLFGADGAAYATLISYGMASFGALLFYSKTRPVFFTMLKSLAAPVRMRSIMKDVTSMNQQGAKRIE